MSNAEAQAQEPSMEEILASIRRIISEDSEGAPAGEPGDDPPSAADDEPSTGDNVLELTEMVGEDGEVVSLKDEAMAEPADAAPDEAAVPEAEAAPEAAPEEPAPAEASEEVAFAETDEAEDRLMSDDRATAAAAAVTDLLGAVHKDPAEAPRLGDARTVEDIARELMRPVLKQWLDENLPGMVERIVRSEIQRVVGHASGQ